MQDYIDGVQDGSIVTGRLERLAVHRHVRDLELAGERGYYFDQKKALAAIEFSRCCNLFEGEWAGKPIPLRAEQKFIVWCIVGWRQKSDGLRRFRQAQIEVARKWGKALAVDTPIPTPTGWTTMGELRNGDVVFDEQGNQCRVTAAMPFLVNRPCYRVEFSDGTSIVADENHEWITTTKYSGMSLAGRCRTEGVNGRSFSATRRDGTVCSATRIRTTRQIADTLTAGGKYGGRPEYNHRVANPDPLQLPTASLPIHPYVLGAWLGDGTSSCASITCSFADHQVIDEIQACGISAKRQESGCTETTGLYLLGSFGRGAASKNSLTRTLRVNGLLNNKHIPEKYLRASETQRWDLLAGLMDTDGCANPCNRQCEFTSTSSVLARGFMELARSLGLKPVLKESRATLYGKDCGARYRIRFSPAAGTQVFRLRRKQEMLDSRVSNRGNGSRSIISVTPIESVPVRCIEVDSPSHLFLAGESMVPTHNSSFAAYLACLFLFFDDPIEHGAQLYVSATKQDQAKIVWNAAHKMIEQSPALRKLAKITPSRLLIELPKYDSTFRPIASDSKTVDGFNPHVVIKDEEHAWREMHRGLADTLASGFGARSQPITITITTYGDDDSLIWIENHDYAVDCLESVIDGNIIDDSWFAFICALDYREEDSQPVACYACKGESCPWCHGAGVLPIDDPYDETIWRKANPGIGSGAGFTPKIERMREAANVARQRADKQPEFFQKNLNIRVAAKGKVIAPEIWAKSAGELGDLTGVKGYGGIDLGRMNDFAATVMVFPFNEVDDDGQSFIRYESMSKVWTVEERTPEMSKPFIEQWIRDGHLIEHRGNAVDFMLVEESILEWHRDYIIGDWAYDKTFAHQLAQRLTAEGVEMFVFGQSHKFYTEPITELLKILGQTRKVNGVDVPLFKHDGNPCVAWQAGNLIVDRNNRGESMPDKSNGNNKIDVMVALLMAFSECLYHQGSDGWVFTPGTLAL